LWGSDPLDNVTEPAIVPPTERTLADLVVQQLRKQIILGRLSPGEHLTEARLSEELDVSRGTVREALRRLEAESLVESFSHRGSRVAALSPDDAVQISEIHSILGAHAVQQLELPIEKDLCRQLTGIAREMRGLRVPDDVDRFIELDNQFHRAIVEASGQRRVLQVWYGVSALLSILVGMSLRDASLTGDEIAAGHELVIAALCQPDHDIASRSIIDHYRANEARLRALVAERENGKGDTIDD
jgi:GntR family transcriptional regulator, gluconate operon transcriptional repressor